ncbi:hypothetical protein ACLOJK_034873, partial [Asimina triloba]
MWQQGRFYIFPPAGSSINPSLSPAGHHLVHGEPAINRDGPQLTGSPKSNGDGRQLQLPKSRPIVRFFSPGQQRGQIANRPIDHPSSAKRWAMLNCNKRRFQKAATHTPSPFAQRKLQHILTVEGNSKFECQAYLN